MKRLSMMLACLAVAACDPAPQPAGDVEGTDGGEDAGTDSNADDGADGSGGPGNGGSIPSEPGVEWSVPLLDDRLILNMEASNERVVVVQSRVFPETHTTVVAYTPTMELDWEIELDEASAVDFTTLDDGSYLLAGGAGPSETQVPGLWHLSCCGELQQSYTYPELAEEPGAAVLVSPHAGGIMMATFGFDGSDIVRLGADFSIEWEANLPGHPIAWALTPDGNLAMTATDEFSTAQTLWDVSTDGLNVGSSLQRPLALVGSGANLTLMASELDQMVIQAFGAFDAVAIPVPQLPFLEAEYAASRGTRLVITNGITNDEGGRSVQLTEADDIGDIHRRLFIDANPGQDFINATVSAVSEDDTIYVVTQQAALGETLMSDLHRIPAL